MKPEPLDCNQGPVPVVGPDGKPADFYPWWPEWQWDAPFSFGGSYYKADKPEQHITTTPESFTVQCSCCGISERFNGHIEGIWLMPGTYSLGVVPGRLWQLTVIKEGFDHKSLLCPECLD